MKNLQDLAKVIRSKNSGPFTLTLDILFRSPDVYYAVKEGSMIQPEVIAKLYGIQPEKILDLIYFDPALAVKVVLPREISSGAPGDSDVYGAQQHSPLLELMLDI